MVLLPPLHLCDSCTLRFKVPFVKDTKKITDILKGIQRETR